MATGERVPLVEPELDREKLKALVHYWGIRFTQVPHYRLWWRFFFRPRIPLTIAA